MGNESENSINEPDIDEKVIIVVYHENGSCSWLKEYES